jgi:transcriptional regulator with XRE-family HTH domain
MKLNIGENIRRLRRAADMTQEQLADKLGVAFQSISRWENGTTYPDIEFLPALAGIFGVTVDELMGGEAIRRDEEIARKMNEFRELCSSETTTAERLLPVLRDLHRSCLPVTRVCEDIWWMFRRILNGNPEIKKNPAIIKELRDTAEELLSRPIPQWMHDSVVWDMAHLEDETYVGSFLERHATGKDLSSDSLLFSRYLRNGDWQKANSIRQKKLYNMVTDLVFGQLLTRFEPRSLEENRQVHDTVLTFLHNLCGVTPGSAYPVTGDGSVDIFVKHRLWLGYRSAAYHAATGDTETAFAALEDTVSMWEAFMGLSEGAAITCKGFCLEGIVMKKTHRCEDDGEEWVRYSDESLDICVHITAREALYPLTDPEAWRSFDPIRTDPRFAAYAERVKAAFALDSKTE